MPPATSICASWRSSASCSLASTTATTSSSASASASSSTAASPASRRARPCRCWGLSGGEHAQAQQLHGAVPAPSGESEAMALIDRMKEYWHQGSSSTAPPSASGRAARPTPCPCNWRTAATRLRRSDPQHRQLIPVDPAGSAMSVARTPLLCQLHLPRAGGERLQCPVSRQMRMASGRQCSMSQSTSFPPRRGLTRTNRSTALPWARLRARGYLSPCRRRGDLEARPALAYAIALSVELGEELARGALAMPGKRLASR